MNRFPTRLLAAAAAVGLAALALPANAAAPTYAPGDVVSVDGATVTAPAPGHAVAMTLDRVDGNSTTLLVSTDADGRVTVSAGGDVVAPDSEAGGSPGKCNDPAYSLINGSSWPGTYEWHYRLSTTPDELTDKQARSALRRSADNITEASNRCGLTDDVSATNSYEGSTTQPSDVNSIPACAAIPGNQNVTEFGDMLTAGVLAATCTYSTGTNGDITDADVRINTDFEWWVSGACTTAYGLKAVMTHEYGHAFGVGHVDEANHGNLTMSTNINGDCSNFEQKLGEGDVLALRDLY